MARRVFRVVGASLAIGAGVLTNIFAKSDTFPTVAGFSEKWPWAVVVGLVVLLVPYLVVGFVRWSSAQLRTIHASDIAAAAIGLILGLIASALLTFPLMQIHFAQLGQWLPILSAVLFGYAGTAIAVLRGPDIMRGFADLGHRRRASDAGDHDDADLIDEPRAGRRGRGKNADRQAPQVLLDTSAIIDGRIAEISSTGFIMGTLVVPRFVLEELQRIADSADSLRRNRGRRGLDILNRLQKESTVPVEVSDTDYESIHEVDAKLVKMARVLHSPIITNDFNLNKVAELQGVKVLNINDLANAVKPALLPGEDMVIKIIQEGKEIGQGVGYLDDGTMIVVESGRPYLNNEIEVTVTRVLQTSAGRMIFAHPKAATPSSLRRSS